MSFLWKSKTSELHLKEEDSPERPLPVIYRPLITSEQMQNQSAALTEQALNDLALYIAANPQVTTPIKQKRKKVCYIFF